MRASHDALEEEGGHFGIVRVDQATVGLDGSELVRHDPFEHGNEVPLLGEGLEAFEAGIAHGVGGVGVVGEEASL